MNATHVKMQQTWLELQATWSRLRVPFTEHMYLWPTAEVDRLGRTHYSVVIKPDFYARGRGIALNGFEDMGTPATAIRHLRAALMSANLIVAGLTTMETESHG